MEKIDKEISKMTDEELIHFIISIFTNWDNRYTISTANLVALFIRKNAILIQKEPLISISDPTKEELTHIVGPQEQTKHIAMKILDSLGAKLIGFERRFPGGIVDVLGRENGKTFAIECGPCRIDKAIAYLREKNTELWLIDGPYSNAESTFHRVIRGPCWDKTIKKYDNWYRKELLKIKSPLDTLYED